MNMFPNTTAATTDFRIKISKLGYTPLLAPPLVLASHETLRGTGPEKTYGFYLYDGWLPISVFRQIVCLICWQHGETATCK